MKRNVRSQLLAFVVVGVWFLVSGVALVVLLAVQLSVCALRVQETYKLRHAQYSYTKYKKTKKTINMRRKESVCVCVRVWKACERASTANWTAELWQ